MEEYMNYEIIKFRDIKSERCFYSWRHIPNTKPITRKQREWLDEQVSYLNEFEKYDY